MTLWTQTGSRGKIAVLVVAAALLACAVAVALSAGGSRQDAPRDATATTQAPAGNAAAAPPKTQPPDNPPAEGVALPAGSRQVEGYQVGFPHSDRGAVAVLVGFTRSQIGFDYDQAAAAARVYAAPADAETIATRAREAVAARRRRLGVPATGDVPAPAAFALTPFAFQATELDSGTYAVTVLNLATTTTAQGEVRNLYYSGTQLVRWVDGDWKVVEGTAEDRQEVLAQPEPPAVGPKDPAFERAGWMLIKQTEAAQ